ncbi:hypothetical protein C1H46_037911 [Malus baccata]|uniref:Uncharacterized protein n=1 Tax=Malus baccata TaxID=106549 RepID=A0A540KQQ4_MALBA|nr:hypothetical protein C1H46_037911 [Malus baccata]
MVDKGQTVLNEATLGRRHGNVHRGLGKARLQDLSASSSRQRTEEVETLTSEVADLKERIAAKNNLMNQIRRALQISGIHFLDVEPPPETTSQPPVTVATTSQPRDAAATPPAGDCDIEDYLF